MTDKRFTDREVDKVPSKKGKQYMWNYIRQKTVGKKEGWSFVGFLKSLIMVPARLASVSAVAAVLIVAIVMTTNFGPLQTETVHAAFAMVANEEDSSGVKSDTSFTLLASADISAEEVRKNLRARPEIAMRVEKTGEGEYKVSPATALEANGVYNFTITGEEGEFSWTYQVRDNFKVTDVLPANAATFVPRDSGIEITFSHENFDIKKFEKYFSISPAVGGTFEKHRRSAVFVPDNILNAGTLYEVTLLGDMPLDGSKQTLGEDFVFQFETRDDKRDNDDEMRFAQDYYETGLDAAVAINVYMSDVERKSDKPLFVGVYRFADINEYRKALDAVLNLPSWSHFAGQNFRHDVNGLVYVGEFEALKDQYRWHDYLYLPQAELQEGYYLLEIQDEGGQGDQALLQVTDLSNYVNVSLTDTLFWVNDVGSDLPVADAKLQVDGLDKIYKTDPDGIAVFETPEQWKNNDFVKNETYVATITSPDDKRLITVLTPTGNENVGSQYWKNFATDRPKYQATDTVEYWGFLKPKHGSLKEDGMSLKLMYNWKMLVQELPLAFDSDGTFAGEVALDNFTPGYYDLVIMDDEKEVNRVSFEVADYVKPAYNMTVESDRQAYFAGENMQFTVRTEFFDGTAAPGIGLDTDDTVSKDLRTGEDGETDVNITSEKTSCYGDYLCPDIHGFYFDVTARFSEDTKIWDGHDVKIFDSHLYLDGTGEVDDGYGLVRVQANAVDLSRLNSADADTDADFLGDVARDVRIEGTIREIYWEKVEDGQAYDFIQKKTTPKYRYEKRVKSLPAFSVQTDDDGKALYSFDVLKDKYYEIDLTGMDPNGDPAHTRVWIYGAQSRSDEYDYYNVKLLNGELAKADNSWFYRSQKHEFDIGTKVQTAVANGETVISDNGRFLFMQQANGIREYAVEDSAHYSFDFDKEDVPNVFIDAVWFDGDSYVDADESSAYYKKELKELDIQMQPDKEKYMPGENVSINVYVQDPDGAPVQAAVNLNLVDEAFYKIAYDNNVSPLESLYAENSSGVLQSYDTHDSPMHLRAGEPGIGGCFTGGTLILMADGSYKPISEVRAGDMILTKEKDVTDSTKMVPAIVNSTVSHFVPEYLIINEELEVTGVHIVYVNGGWDMVDNLEVGDKMLGSDGAMIEIASIRKVKKPVWVYNFEVDGQHTYFANDYYVHNDKGGGGAYMRSDFKDTAIFDVIQTNAQGRGKFEFKLPDNITSWRVIAKAIDTVDLQAGMEISSLVVSQPFFADIIMNKSYSDKDLPQIGVRAFGDELESGEKVYFGASSETLDLEEAVIGKAFETSFLDLGELVSGEHEITVLAESGDLKDALKESVDVVGSRLEKNVVGLMKNVTASSEFTLGENGQTEISFMDGGIAFYYSDLWQMYFNGGDRLDQRLASIVAADLVNKYFGKKWSYNADDLTANYQKNDSGLSLLPFGDADLRLSAMALTADNNPARFSTNGLKDYFYGVYMDQNSNLEEVVLSLLGLANLNEPVLVSLRTLQSETTLTLEQKLYIALAFEVMGSRTEAREIYDAVFDELADDEDSARATALGAILAASFGETEAADLLWDFVELTGIEDELVLLEKLAYLGHSLASASPESVVFSVNGEKVGLDLWAEYGMVVSPGDKVQVDVEKGDLAAVVHYTENVEPEDFDGDERLSIRRSYKVDGNETTRFKDGDLVLVNLEVDFSGKIAHPFFQVTDILPSGLKFVTLPVAAASDVYNRDFYRHPYRVNGQEVTFYWSKPKTGEVVRTIQYYARVVHPGKFYADPAKIENYYDPALANISDSNIIEIQAVHRNL